MNYDEAILIIENEKLPNVSIKGLMGMASFTDDRSQIQDEFDKLHTFYQEYRSREQWDTLSMGMSGDYQLAIDSGSNMIRVGSRIFGARN